MNTWVCAMPSAWLQHLTVLLQNISQFFPNFRCYTSSLSFSDDRQQGLILAVLSSYFTGPNNMVQCDLLAHLETALECRYFASQIHHEHNNLKKVLPGPGFKRASCENTV